MAFNLPGSFPLADASVQTVDINNSRAMDFMVVDPTRFSFIINGDGASPNTFYESAPTPIAANVSFADGWQLADMNGDRMPDLAVVDTTNGGGVVFYPGKGWGEFDALTAMTGGPSDTQLGSRGRAGLSLVVPRNQRNYPSGMLLEIGMSALQFNPQYDPTLSQDFGVFSTSVALGSDDKFLAHQWLEAEHFLGSFKPVGHSLCHLIYEDGALVAIVQWAACAYHLKDREAFIGWSSLQCAKRRNLIVNNVRFLVLDSARRPNLARKRSRLFYHPQGEPTQPASPRHRSIYGGHDHDHGHQYGHGQYECRSRWIKRRHQRPSKLKK